MNYNIFKLKNNFITATFTDYGARILSLVVYGKDVLFGFENINGYIENADGYHGAVCGRFANRIKDGKFCLNGKTYQLNKNSSGQHLHGGLNGFDKKIWDSKLNEDSITFSYISQNGEENYPGSFNVSITYTLDENRLRLDYKYYSDKDTIANITNHAYFNLDGDNNSILDHKLMINADFYTPIDEHIIPTGEILKVNNSLFDFRELKPIRENFDKFSDTEQFKFASGIDHNFVLNKMEDCDCVLLGTKSGIKMTIKTDRQGLQVYTGNFMNNLKGKNGLVYDKHSAIALETQLFPASTSFAHFTDPVIKKGKIYKSYTVLEFDK